MVQILAGNARKVSAVRFERINHDDAELGTKGVRHLAPKIIAKWNKQDESNNDEDNNEVSFQGKTENGSCLSNNFVKSEHENSHELHNIE